MNWQKFLLLTRKAINILTVCYSILLWCVWSDSIKQHTAAAQLEEMDSSNFYTLTTLSLSANCTCGATRHSIQLHVAWAAFVKHSPAKHRENTIGDMAPNQSQIFREVSPSIQMSKILAVISNCLAESSFGFNLLHAGFPDVSRHLLYDLNTLCDPKMEAMPQALRCYAMHQTSPTKTSSMKPNTSFEPYLANYYEHKHNDFGLKKCSVNWM